jgi:hypothetical protein
MGTQWAGAEFLYHWRAAGAFILVETTITNVKGAPVLKRSMA